ncbi:MAG: hypothetical protein BMS9Abin29_1311 [Gemmatimonadota bacterium]|nr:MAG: hypothetical protein BMS9Abin29_1311 [Gemmatimonadota bacterium]
MPTVRGFVQQIEIGRAGLVRAFLIHADGSQGTYVIHDLDGDPERFNERLAKLGILRDAMNRAEPVEVEYIGDDAGEVIDRIRRISRDDLSTEVDLNQAVGLIVDVTVTTETGIDANGERLDSATIRMLTTQLKGVQLRLVLQPPERGVALAQLDLLEEARRSGVLARVVYDQSDGHNDIVGVAVDVGTDRYSGEDGQAVDGFVESLGLLSAGVDLGPFARVRFTTAPPFTGNGNTISMVTFDPQTLDLIVAKGSVNYELFEAGLRDNLRMRVEGSASRADRKDLKDLKEYSFAGALKTAEQVMLVTGCTLLAPFASASRPVWVKISRRSLDHGPDGWACTPGVPSSDLAPRTLRDLNLPYPAEWVGWACFNDGIYRFQLDVPTDFSITVDHEELCLFNATNEDGEESEQRVAHACLGGHHEVRVALDAWKCDYEFIMDVFQIR